MVPLRKMTKAMIRYPRAIAGSACLLKHKVQPSSSARDSEEGDTYQVNPIASIELASS